MPGEVPFCKTKLKREHALSSMPGKMPFCQKQAERVEQTRNRVSQDRLSSSSQGAGGNLMSVHGVHPSRGKTHSCRFKGVAACMQHAERH